MVRLLFPSLLLLASFSVAFGGMYGEYVTELTPSNFDDLVIKSTETWLVKFYAPWCGHCKQSAPAFSKAAKKMHGIARLGVVNCDEHQELAQRFSVRGFPTIKVFKGEGKKARRPSDYTQARSSSAFIDHVKHVMPSFVARVKPTGVQAFFQDLPKLPHVLLFTDKKSTSPLYKGLSARFKGRLSFGEVRKSEAMDVPKQFSVSSYPTLLAFNSGESEPTSARTFEGKMDPDSLMSFFETVAGNQMNGTGFAAQSGEEKSSESERVFAQPKAYSGEVTTIVGRKQFEELCDARKDGRMCVLSILKGGEEHSMYDILGNIAQIYQYDNMAFSVIDGNDKGARKYATMFGIGGDNGLVVIRARKRKYTKLSGDLGSDEISAFLDHIVGGDAHWTKLENQLPDWESPEDNAPGNNSTSGEKEDEGTEQCGTEPPKDGGSCGAPKDDL